MTEDEARLNGLRTRKMIRNMILEGRSKKDVLHLIELIYNDEETKYLMEGLSKKKVRKVKALKVK